MNRSRRRLVHTTGLAGVLASLAYAAGDVLLPGQKIRPERHLKLAQLPGVDPPVLSMVPSSTGRLAVGALVGVYATPLYLAAVWHLHQGLAPAGPRRALPPVLVRAGAWTSFIHGSFFQTARRTKPSNDSPPTRASGRHYSRPTSSSSGRRVARTCRSVGATSGPVPRRTGGLPGPPAATRRHPGHRNLRRLHPTRHEREDPGRPHAHRAAQSPASPHIIANESGHYVPITEPAVAPDALTQTTHSHYLANVGSGLEKPVQSPPSVRLTEMEFSCDIADHCRNES